MEGTLAVPLPEDQQHLSGSFLGPVDAPSDSPAPPVPGHQLHSPPTLAAGTLHCLADPLSPGGHLGAESPHAPVCTQTQVHVRRHTPPLPPYKVLSLRGMAVLSSPPPSSPTTPSGASVGLDCVCPGLSRTWLRWCVNVTGIHAASSRAGLEGPSQAPAALGVSDAKQSGARS